MKIILEGEKCPTWNTFYKGGHWGERSDEAKRIHLLVRAAIDPEAPPISVPVNVRVTAVYRDKRRRDSDNVAAKFYIDGLKDLVIPEDDTRFVKEVTTVSKHDPSGDRVEIEIKPLF